VDAAIESVVATAKGFFHPERLSKTDSISEHAPLVNVSGRARDPWRTDLAALEDLACGWAAAEFAGVKNPA
jgi:hypothetical protein